ncbi:MAG: methionine--tRNA ligase subunit beta [Patescibacteria group bacterium UBA2163]
MNISIDDFAKVELRVGTVLVAERVPSADKLLRLEVDLGEETPRQILSGIAEYCDPKELVERQFMFVTNLAPRVLRGLTSQGMLLVTGEGESLTIPTVSQTVPPGSIIH